MKIQKLPDEVIKKICAGEVVTRPYNALKELLENSIDAESSNISINISSNVLNITIEDNGCGIKKDDFELLCERHCTSKIHHEGELLRVSSYGFRGEALSSISQVSKITVKSKTREDDLGYEGLFSNGKLVELKPIPLREGTIMTVKDIFYNNKIRELKYFKKINELNSMIDLIFSYAVNNINIRFSLFVTGKEKFLTKWKDTLPCRCCKNFIHEDSSFNMELINLRNSLSNGLISENTSSYHNEDCIKRKIDLIGRFHKINGKLSSFDSKYATVIFSKPSANFKKNLSIIFINGRLVENTSLKEYLSKIYVDILPKHRFPLVYVELRIPPGDIDVNIHPSKKEVLFNHEDIITEILGKVIEGELKEYFSNEKENFSFQESIKRYKPVVFNPKSDETKVYIDPNIGSLHETKKEAVQINKEYSLRSLQDLRDSYVEIDKDFFKSLTFVANHEDKEFYVQHSQFLLSCSTQIFLTGFIKEFFIFNFGNFTPQNVKIPIRQKIEFQEMLGEYFSIQMSDNEITQIPTIFGQYNDRESDWSTFDVIGTDEKEVFEHVFSCLTEIYVRTFVFNSATFNLIKRSIKGTKSSIETFTIVSQIKDLYKKFGR